MVGVPSLCSVVVGRVSVKAYPLASLAITGQMQNGADRAPPPAAARGAAATLML
jgi:hypothetical protein